MEGIMSREQFAKAKLDFEMAQTEYRKRYSEVLAAIGGRSSEEAKQLIINFHNAAVACYCAGRVIERGDLNA